MGACCSNDPKNGEADTTLSIVEDGKLSSADNSQRGETISPRTEEGLDSPDDTASSKHTSVEEPSAGHQRVDQLERQNSTISCGSLPSAIPEPIQERRKSMLGVFYSLAFQIFISTFISCAGVGRWKLSDLRDEQQWLFYFHMEERSRGKSSSIC